MKCHRVSRFLNRRRALVMAVGATIAVGSALSATPAKATSRDGYDRRIAVLNQSSDAIVDLRASDVGRPDWGPDLLGEDVLAPGESGVLNPPEDWRGYCRYDVRFELSDGSVFVRHNMNVCDSMGIVLR